jgi:hypothetical protein
VTKRRYLLYLTQHFARDSDINLADNVKGNQIILVTLKMSKNFSR